MEEQPTPVPSGAANPAAPAPIMDIKAPPQPAGPPGVVPEPAGSAPAKPTSPAKQTDKPTAAAKAPPRQPAAKGVNAAIIATVVIVLGLAALAVYAYTKTK